MPKNFTVEDNHIPKFELSFDFAKLLRSISLKAMFSIKIPQSTKETINIEIVISYVYIYIEI